MCPHARTPSPVQVSARTIKPKEKDFDPKKRIVGIPVRRTLPRPFLETLPRPDGRPFRDPSMTPLRRVRDAIASEMPPDASRCLQMRALSL